MNCEITQKFGENANDSYKGSGLSGHTGIDTSCGFQSKIFWPWENGYVYKIFTKSNPASDGFTGIFAIVEQDGECFEYLIGHCEEIFCYVGQQLKYGDEVGLEGNEGAVFTSGRPCTIEEKKSTSCGTHRHNQKRPLIKVKSTNVFRRYLQDINGIYIDKERFYYEYKYPENGYNGCVDFDLQEVYKKSLLEKLVALYTELLALMKKNYQ